MISRDHAEAVCEGLKETYPGTDPPTPRTDPRNPKETDHWDPAADAVIIHSGEYVLGVSEQCFQYHEDDEIVKALVGMDYARHLKKVKRLDLGCAPRQAPADQDKLETWGDWYLLASSA